MSDATTDVTRTEQDSERLGVTQLASGEVPVEVESWLARLARAVRRPVRPRRRGRDDAATGVDPVLLPRRELGGGDGRRRLQRGRPLRPRPPASTGCCTRPCARPQRWPLARCDALCAASRLWMRRRRTPACAAGSCCARRSSRGGPDSKVVMACGRRGHGARGRPAPARPDRPRPVARSLRPGAGTGFPQRAPRRVALRDHLRDAPSARGADRGTVPDLRGHRARPEPGRGARCPGGKGHRCANRSCR